MGGGGEDVCSRDDDAGACLVGWFFSLFFFWREMFHSLFFFFSSVDTSKRESEGRERHRVVGDRYQTAHETARSHLTSSPCTNLKPEVVSKHRRSRTRGVRKDRSLRGSRRRRRRRRHALVQGGVAAHWGGGGGGWKEVEWNPCIRVAPAAYPVWRGGGVRRRRCFVSSVEEIKRGSLVLEHLVVAFVLPLSVVRLEVRRLRVARHEVAFGDADVAELGDVVEVCLARATGG